MEILNIFETYPSIKPLYTQEHPRGRGDW